jgi:ACR3 family arsenite efflux pump ArsB
VQRPVHLVTKEPIMEKQIIVPLAIFICVTFLYKITLDAIMRYRMLREPGTEHLLQSLLQGEQAQRRLASLRVGLVMIGVATGSAIIEWTDIHRVTPGTVAILVGCTGIAHLVYFLIARKQT